MKNLIIEKHQHQNLEAYTNPIVQQTFESLPRIYGSIKKRIFNKKQQFYNQAHRRLTSNIVKQLNVSVNISKRQISRSEHRKKQNSNSRIFDQRKNQIWLITKSNKEGVKFDNKFEKLQRRKQQFMKKTPPNRSDEKETSHKVKLNTLNILPNLFDSRTKSNQTRFTDIVNEKVSKSVSITRGPQVKLQLRPKQKRYSNPIKQQNESSSSSSNEKQYKFYVPKSIKMSKRLRTENNQTNSSYSKASRMYTQSNKTNTQQKTNYYNQKMTEFSRRLRSGDRSSAISSLIQTDHKYHIPQKDEYANFIRSYQPLSAGFNMKQLIKKDDFQIISYDNQAVYFGEFNGIRQGRAIYITETSIFQGFYKNDEKHKGSEINFDGIYTGYFNKNLREGVGKFEWNNGEVYEGQWHSGKKDGHGVWRGPNGDSYEGSWKNGRQHGKGKHTHKKSVYVGYFSGSLKQGEGQEIFQNGDKYKGEYSHGKPQGKGRYDWKDGSFYEGQFKNGYREGSGVLYQKNKLNYKAKVLLREILSTGTVNNITKTAISTRASFERDFLFLNRIFISNDLNLNIQIYRIRKGMDRRK